MHSQLHNGCATAHRWSPKLSGQGRMGPVHRAHGGWKGTGRTSGPNSGSNFLPVGIWVTGAAPIGGRHFGDMCCLVKDCVFSLRISGRVIRYSTADVPHARARSRHRHQAGAVARGIGHSGVVRGYGARAARRDVWQAGDAAGAQHVERDGGAVYAQCGEKPAESARGNG